MAKPSWRSQHPLLGAHLSIAGGLHKALLKAREYSCSTLQIFTKSARTWNERLLSPEEIRKFDQAREETKIRAIASHTAYLINLASPDRNLYEQSIRALTQELIRSSRLGLQHVVLHPGAHKGSGAAAGLRRIATGLNRALAAAPKSTCRILLETTAGHGSALGSSFEEISEILEKVEGRDNIGVCLDTCHVFAAGYDLRTEETYRQTMNAFDRALGLNSLKIIHLNDAKGPFGSRLDRHHHIGRGYIGQEAFRLILNDPKLTAIPKIIETPKKLGSEEGDPINLARLRRLVALPGALSPEETRRRY